MIYRRDFTSGYQACEITPARYLLHAAICTCDSASYAQILHVIRAGSRIIRAQFHGDG